MDEPRGRSVKSAGPMAVALVAVVAAAGIVYNARDRLLNPPVETAAPAPAAPAPIVEPAPAPAPVEAARETSPLPFASSELKAPPSAAAPPAPLEVTVSEFEPERGVSQGADRLRAMQPAPAQAPEAKLAPQPHLRPMANLSGYLEGEHRTTAHAAGGAGNAQLAAALTQLGRQIAAQQKAGGAAAPKVAAPPRVSLMMGQEAAKVAYPEGRAMTIYVAPWCPFCARGVPQYQELRQRLALRGVDVRIVVMDDKRESLEAFASKVGPGAIAAPDAVNPAHGYPAIVMSSAGKATAVHMGDFGSAAEGQAWALGH